MPPIPDVLQAFQVQALISYLDHESTPMIVMNTEYEILAANTAYKRQFAIAGQPYVGKKCYSMSHHYNVPCDQVGERCPLQSVLATKGPDRVLHIHPTPRGPEHVDVELRPIIDAQHRVVGFVERLQIVRHASAQPSHQGLVGKSGAFNKALGELQRVAGSGLPVLLLGESGTGKELFAHALHEASPRSHGPFVVVDCSGLTETLFESELFGYEKGAFTGAASRKAGLVEIAKDGTLFLDEIGDVPLAMQVKLLRLIESGTYRRVGGVDTLQAEFRLVAATHKPLQKMVAEGSFRQDLYYRISTFPIHLPALRQRREDIPLLVESLMQRSANATGKRMQVSPEAMVVLASHEWLGNIRELRNVLERARLFATDGEIKPEHLSLEAPSALSATTTGQLEGTALAEFARHFKGTRKELALALGLSERTLYRRLKALGLA